MGAFEEVDLPKGEWTIDLKWVFAHKTDSDGLIIWWKEKAQLVDQGFNQHPGQYDGAYAPVANFRVFVYFSLGQQFMTSTSISLIVRLHSCTPRSITLSTVAKYLVILFCVLARHFASSLLYMVLVNWHLNSTPFFPHSLYHWACSVGMLITVFLSAIGRLPLIPPSPCLLMAALFLFMFPSMSTMVLLSPIHIPFMIGFWRCLLNTSSLLIWVSALALLSCVTVLIVGFGCPLCVGTTRGMEFILLACIYSSSIQHRQCPSCPS